MWLAMLFVLCLSGRAQTEGFARGDNRMEECRSLMREGHYRMALDALARLDASAIPQADKGELEWMKAAATCEVDARQGKPLLERYLYENPYSPYRNESMALLGTASYFEGDYDKAVEYFDATDLDALPTALRDRSSLYFSMSLIHTGKTQRAALLLNVLEQTGGKYGDDAIFYRATIDYYNGKIDAAWEGFKKVETNDRFILDVPYFLGAIEIKRGQYERAASRASYFIKNFTGVAQITSMQQILGAALFLQGKYSEAIAPLSAYVNHAAHPQRISLYQWGMSCFQTGDMAGAVRLLDRVTDENDEIAQNAYLHIGLARLDEGNVAMARMAFEQASRSDFNKQVKEEALYNYALCIHKEHYSPFAESVKVFERFLNEFPRSRYANEVNGYLVDVYLGSRNYKEALASIDKINNPGTALLEAKQRILYHLGLQAFIDNHFDNAVEYFTRSIELGERNPATRANACYWRGEARYRMGQYDLAAADYRAAIASPVGENRDKALYGMGYVSYQKHDFENALSHFSRFVEQNGTDSRMKADALNRMGDCYFYRRDFDHAVALYKQGWGTHAAVGDYAMYRCALVLGLKKEYAKKVELLNSLIATYPSSSYAQNAYYELGRSYVELEQKEDALKTFQALRKQYPQSSLARKAAAEIATLYYQAGESQKAIAAYKDVIKSYPGSDEASVAAQDLKSIYVEMDKVDEYANFASHTRGMQAIEGNERDTLTYTAAEKVYMKGDIEEAKMSLNRYLQQYPMGAFRLNAHYYLGIIYNNQNQRDEALAHLREVVAYPDNKYSEEAMALCSQIAYNGGDYAEAEKLYEAIAAKTSNASTRSAARMNLLRCAYQLKEEDKVLSSSTLLLGGNTLSADETTEARYYRAKAYLWKKKGSEALPDLKALSRDTRNEKGAEAKYLLAQVYYDNKKYGDAEKVVLDYINVSTPYPYWLARSFVLLSDVYLKQNRTLEAKQYLLSLKNNYQTQDDIAGMIEERLALINKMETKKK